MTRTVWLTVSMLALTIAGCNSGGYAEPANVGANDFAAILDNAAAGNEAAVANVAVGGTEAAGNGAAESLCLFQPGDVKDWKAVQGKPGTRTAGMIIVTGKARTGDPKYEARLTRAEGGREAGMLRLRLARAEQDDPDSVPADGWYELRYGPGESGISKVVIACDEETTLAELGVEKTE